MLQILGDWLGMRSFFERRDGILPVMMKRPGTRMLGDIEFQRLLSLDICLTSLVQESSLIPTKNETTFTTAESLHETEANETTFLNSFIAGNIKGQDLNVYTLRKYANVGIHWTDNVCRHLLLSEQGGKPMLELFDRPTLLKVQQRSGLGLELNSEVLASYSILFAQDNTVRRLHWNPFVQLSRWYRRYRYHSIKKDALNSIRKDSEVPEKNKQSISVFDEDILNMVDSHFHVSDSESLYSPQNWEEDKFSILWLRIEKLNQFQRNAKPWKLGVLLSDRRDTFQWWTFL
jgi:hypothetical protein